ncbi:hypothetical protein BDQ17DRAFT_1426138 [Cyathus striatus]|nr:hypothetical protein BDQ17DRAFT_1426138 [Cyathus striatus]
MSLIAFVLLFSGFPIASTQGPLLAVLGHPVAHLGLSAILIEVYLFARFLSLLQSVDLTFLRVVVTSISLIAHPVRVLADIAVYPTATGTICLNDGLDTIVHCINAVGTTSAALPSSTSIKFSPAISAIPDAAVEFGPQEANTIYSTDVINATVSLNFTGRGILINAISSPSGGVFSVIFDDTLLSDTIDTFNNKGEQCFVRQYPPFKETPSDLAVTLNHSIILTYQGPSTLAPNGTLSSMVQFQSFDIPQFTTTNGALKAQLPNAYILAYLLLVIWSLTSS